MAIGLGGFCNGISLAADLLLTGFVSRKCLHPDSPPALLPLLSIPSEIELKLTTTQRQNSLRHHDFLHPMHHCVRNHPVANPTLKAAYFRRVAGRQNRTLDRHDTVDSRAWGVRSWTNA